MAVFLRLMRVNDAGVDQESVWLNPDHVVAVVGEEDAPTVTVLTSTAVAYRVRKLAPGDASILKQIKELD